MKMLIINADDFGLTPGVNRAVIRAHREGILTSATLMAGGLAWEEAVELSGSTPTLGVGVHLTLTALKPVLPPEQVPSLVDAKGRFRRQFWRVLFWKRKQVIEEWRGQIERVMAAGLRPTHLDSHHHIHLWPPLMTMVGELAREYSIPGIRAISPASFGVMRVPFWQRHLAVASWRRGKKLPQGKPKTVTALELIGKTRERFDAYLHQLPAGVHELFSHPGSQGDLELSAISSLTDNRFHETELLCSDWIKDSMRGAGITPVSYKIFS